MRQIRLASEARQLKRRIFASLPFQIRVAYFAIRLAVQSDEEFGRILYAYFAMRGVKGLPEIKGKTVEDLGFVGLDPRSKLNMVVRKLPKGYGKVFGKKAKAIIYKILLTKNVGDVEDIVESSMSHIMLMLISKMPNMEGKTLKEAELYIINSLKNFISNYLKRHSTWKEQQMPETEEGEILEFSDPSSLQNFLKAIPRPQQFLRELLNVAQTENQETMLKLRFQGYSNADIARELGVDPAIITRFFKSREDELREVVERYI